MKPRKQPQLQLPRPRAAAGGWEGSPPGSGQLASRRRLMRWPSLTQALIVVGLILIVRRLYKPPPSPAATSPPGGTARMHHAEQLEPERSLRSEEAEPSETATGGGREAAVTPPHPPLAAAVFSKPRAVVKKTVNTEPHGGGPAEIYSAFSRSEYDTLDPFLLLDEAKRFETVTYVIDGVMSHEDFEGHAGLLRSGDVQWMTAGRGIVHSELPASPRQNHGLQLWVNLPARDKMCKPNYQELAHGEIPQAERGGVRVKVIAGEAMGVSSPVRTLNPTMYLDFTMRPGSEMHQAIPEGWNAFCYVLAGSASFGAPDARESGPHTTLHLGRGDGVSVWKRAGPPGGGGGDCRFLLIAGRPIGEPVAQYGPFVMNTQAEIKQAMSDYQLGTNGFEKARGWKSSGRFAQQRRLRRMLAA
eukprot:jgi/Mesen1/6258/ME000323S05385